MNTTISLAAIASFLFLGLAGAHTDIDLTPAGGSIYYLPDDGDLAGAATGGPNDLNVYEESNGCEGLQTEPVDCLGDEELEPADTIVVGP